MKTFSEFSLNLFCLLFGFFLGNLFPDQSIFEQIFGTKAERGVSPISSQRNLTEGIFASDDIALQTSTFSNPVNLVSWRLDLLPTSFPGPSQVGLSILVLSEFINWNGAFWKKRAGGANKVPPCSHNQFFILFNSFKIGLLFGIFVDAFKVGS